MGRGQKLVNEFMLLTSRGAFSSAFYVTGRWKQVSANGERALCGGNRCVSRWWPLTDPGGRAARLMRRGCVYVTHRHSHCRYTLSLTHMRGAARQIDLICSFLSPHPQTHAHTRTEAQTAQFLPCRPPRLHRPPSSFCWWFPIKLSLRNFRVTEVVGRNLSLYSRQFANYRASPRKIEFLINCFRKIELLIQLQILYQENASKNNSASKKFHRLIIL